MQKKDPRDAPMELEIAVRTMPHVQDDPKFQMERVQDLIHTSENCTQTVLEEARFTEQVKTPISPGMMKIAFSEKGLGTKFIKPVNVRPIDVANSSKPSSPGEMRNWNARIQQRRMPIQQ